MNATIDIGNSRIKLGIFENSQLTVAKLINNGEEAVDYLKNTAIQNVIMCTVGHPPQWFDSISFSGNSLLLTKDTPMPIKINYDTPETLGMDRIAACAGASIRYPKKNCLVIDMGTCVTYDFLDEEGFFQGGSISPGLKMRLNAMHEKTSKLPLIEDFNATVKLTGKNTRESMISGAIMGLVQEIEGFIRSYQDKVANLQIIFTGGDFKMVENLLSVKHNWSNHLVLEGLNEILEHNTKENFSK